MPPSEPLRVAMIGQYSVPASYGGVERVVEELGAELAAGGVDVTIYCSPTADGQHLSTWRGMHLVRTPRFGGKHLGKLTMSACAAVQALRGDFDVVHYHAMGPCLFAPLTRWCSRAAVVATIHGRDDLRAKWSRPARILLRAAAWSSAKAPHAVMVVSQELQRDYQRTFRTATTVVHNGIPPVTDRGDAAELDRWGLQSGGYLLHVGRLVPEKAADVLVEAFRRAQLPETNLAVVGESAHTDDFAATVRAAGALDDRVRFLGSVYGAPLDALYRHAAGFVLPSRLEGLPVVLLEAIERGLPIVASALPAHLEVLGDSGPGRRVVPVDDVDRLASEMERVVKDNDVERAGAELLRQDVAASFNWTAAARITRRVYDAAVSKRTSAASS